MSSEDFESGSAEALVPELGTGAYPVNFINGIWINAAYQATRSHTNHTNLSIANTLAEKLSDAEYLGLYQDLILREYFRSNNIFSAQPKPDLIGRQPEDLSRHLGVVALEGAAYLADTLDQISEHVDKLKTKVKKGTAKQPELQEAESKATQQLKKLLIDALPEQLMDAFIPVYQEAISRAENIEPLQEESQAEFEARKRVALDKAEQRKLADYSRAKKLTRNKGEKRRDFTRRKKQSFTSADNYYGVQVDDINSWKQQEAETSEEFEARKAANVQKAKRSIMYKVIFSPISLLVKSYSEKLWQPFIENISRTVALEELLRAMAEKFDQYILDQQQQAETQPLTQTQQAFFIRTCKSAAAVEAAAKQQDLSAELSPAVKPSGALQPLTDSEKTKVRPRDILISLLAGLAGSVLMGAILGIALPPAQTAVKLATVLPIGMVGAFVATSLLVFAGLMLSKRASAKKLAAAPSRQSQKRNGGSRTSRGSSVRHSHGRRYDLLTEEGADKSQTRLFDVHTSAATDDSATEGDSVSAEQGQRSNPDSNSLRG